MEGHPDVLTASDPKQLDDIAVADSCSESILSTPLSLLQSSENVTKAFTMNSSEELLSDSHIQLEGIPSDTVLEGICVDDLSRIQNEHKLYSLSKEQILELENTTPFASSHKDCAPCISNDVGNVSQVDCDTSLVQEDNSTRGAVCDDEPSHVVSNNIDDANASDSAASTSRTGNTDILEEEPNSACEESMDTGSSKCFDLGDDLLLLTGSWKEFDEENFLRGCKWAPDGSCLLTCSEDNKMRLYNLPSELYSEINALPNLDMSPVLRIPQATGVYDYCWYPKMNSWEPNTCCFATTCKDQPIHMWDAFYGHKRGSYVPYNHLDEVVSPYSLAFSLDGEKLYAGLNKSVKVFNTSRPGRTCTTKTTYDKKDGGQSGILSCISMHPINPGTFAVGSFSCSVAVYTDTDRHPVITFTGMESGVTHIQFTKDGDKVMVGFRKNNNISCWDLRNPMKELVHMEREVTTNQRIYFDQSSDGRYLLTGSTSGSVFGWDLQHIAQVTSSNGVIPHCLRYAAHNDAVNGCSVHPTLPLLATCSGQRSFSVDEGTDSDFNDSELSKGHLNNENSVKIWSFIGSTN